MTLTCCQCRRRYIGRELKDKKALRICRECIRRAIISFERQMRQHEIVELERIHVLNQREVPVRLLRVENGN